EGPPTSPPHPTFSVQNPTAVDRSSPKPEPPRHRARTDSPFRGRARVERSPAASLRGFAITRAGGWGSEPKHPSWISTAGGWGSEPKDPSSISTPRLNPPTSTTGPPSPESPENPEPGSGYSAT